MRQEQLRRERRAAERGGGRLVVRSRGGSERERLEQLRREEEERLELERQEQLRREQEEQLERAGGAPARGGRQLHRERQEQLRREHEEQLSGRDWAAPSREEEERLHRSGWSGSVARRRSGRSSSARREEARRAAAAAAAAEGAQSLEAQIGRSATGATSTSKGDGLARLVGLAVVRWRQRYAFTTPEALCYQHVRSTRHLQRAPSSCSTTLAATAQRSHGKITRIAFDTIRRIGVEADDPHVLVLQCFERQYFFRFSSAPHCEVGRGTLRGGRAGRDVR